MGTDQAHAMLATGFQDGADAAFERVRAYARELADDAVPLREDFELLLVRVPGVINRHVTYALFPSGSKVGWDTADRHALLCGRFRDEMKPWAYHGVIEVSWGEQGNRLTTHPGMD
jgi:hypothetical protein